MMSERLQLKSAEMRFNMRSNFAIAVIVLALVVPMSGADKIVFKKVDVFVTEGDNEKKRDARLELYPDERILALVDEKNGSDKATYAVVPYDKVTNVVYERSAHRRYKSAIFGSVWMLFTKGKKHWLTIEFQGVSDHPEGFVYARLDKENYRRILSAVSAATGLEVEQYVED